MSVPDWFENGLPHIWLPYTQMQTAPPPLPAVRTQGARITLADGRELIDGIASWWTACHGYNHPHIAEAVTRQLAAMPHVMFGGLAHEPALTLARRLTAMLPAPLTRVFFCDSGSVAVEVAMKMAVQVWLNRGESRRTKFLSFRGGYHGDTFAAMSVCDPEEGMHGLFSGVLARQVIADLPTDAPREAAFEAVLDAHAPTLAAIIVEPLAQGAGGMIFHSPEVLRKLRRAADKAWPAFDFRRGVHRLRPHRDAVRLRGGGRCSRHHRALQGADGRDHGARRDGRLKRGVRGFRLG